MPWKVRLRDGKEYVDAQTEPRDMNWYQGSFNPVVACEWVEPKKEYRWRATWANGEFQDCSVPPVADAFIHGDLRLGPYVKVERIEVTS